MKHASAILLACMTFNAHASEPLMLPVVRQMQKLANASLCESYKGDTSSFGKAMNKQCQNKQRAEFEAIQDEKPLRDCIKPGNVIDDDVRKCMKGL